MCFHLVVSLLVGVFVFECLFVPHLGISSKLETIQYFGKFGYHGVSGVPGIPGEPGVPWVPVSHGVPWKPGVCRVPKLPSVLEELNGNHCIKIIWNAWST